MLFFLGFLVVILEFAKAGPNYVKQADLLFDISLVQNSSNNGIDFHISMASHFGPKGGWVALGTGHIMKGSLMFIMYPTDEKCITPRSISHDVVLETDIMVLIVVYLTVQKAS